MLPHLFTNFEIQKHYQSAAKSNGVYSRNNLAQIKDRAYVINLDEYKSIGTHRVALYVNGENVLYFDGFVVEHIPKKNQKNSQEIKLLEKYFQNTIGFIILC